MEQSARELAAKHLRNLAKRIEDGELDWGDFTYDADIVDVTKDTDTTLQYAASGYGTIVINYRNNAEADRFERRELQEQARKV